jgi:hypothetical protein
MALKLYFIKKNKDCMKSEKKIKLPSLPKKQQKNNFKPIAILLILSFIVASIIPYIQE